MITLDKAKKIRPGDRLQHAVSGVTVKVTAPAKTFTTNGKFIIPVQMGCVVKEITNANASEWS